MSQRFVYTCAKCHRPTDMAMRVAQVRCCGADITDPVEMDARAAQERYNAWVALTGRKPPKPRKKGGGKR